jgi:F-type H+-transporting ATPase subunit b
MRIESAVALISINATLIIQLLSFLIFLFIINRIMFKPLVEVQGSRTSRMEAMRRQITEAEQTVARMLAELSHKELQAKDEAFERQRVLDADAKHQADQIFDAVKAEIETLKVQTHQNVKAQIQNVREHLAAESRKLSRVIMEKTLERRLTDETIE